MSTQVPGDSRPRVGVVGTAHWAREVHAAGAVASQADLVAVWGRNREAREEIAERYGVEACRSLEELVERVDIVTIAVPPQVQPGIAVAAARAGKHLLLEKPVATSTREAEEIDAALRAGGGRAMVFFTRRFAPEIERAVAALGHDSWSAAQVRAHSNVTVADSPYRESRWRRDPGSALWDLGPHVLSLLIPVLGPVREVSATHGGEATVVSTVHQGGARARLSVSLHAGSPADEYRFIRADGSEVRLPVVEFDGPALFARALDRLVAMIGDPGRRDPVSLELGVEVTRVLEQAERSLNGPGSASR